jgi:hypothetical protein
LILEDLRGFKRPPPIDTREDIFPSNNPENEIKVNRNKKIKVKRKKLFKQRYDDKIGGIISPRGSGKISLEKNYLPNHVIIIIKL